MKRVVVVGGGAAGLMAAGIAREGGADVVLVEKMASPARKLRITGKGRCNITNSAPLSEFLEHFGTNGRFLRQALQQFFSAELIRFFEEKGLAVVYERGGRIFPKECGAPEVVAVMLDWLDALGVQIVSGQRVREILLEDGVVQGVCTTTDQFYGDAVILATGGKSYPGTGSSGDGYRLAEKVGHTITPLYPALVPLRSDEKAVTGLNGLTLRNVCVRLFIAGRRKAQGFGEIAFTANGITGPVILTLSDIAVRALKEKKPVAVHIDLKPALDEKKLDARLIRDLEKRRKEPMADVLRGVLPQPLVPLCLESSGITATQTAGTLPAKMRKRIRHWLKNLRFEITGYGTWKEAIVTAGGVALGEVDPKTMASKKVAGLYIVGELLDLHGDTGGFNLQSAFSTGWLAGKSVVQ